MINACYFPAIISIKNLKVLLWSQNVDINKKTKTQPIGSMTQTGNIVCRKSTICAKLSKLDSPIGFLWRFSMSMTMSTLTGQKVLSAEKKQCFSSKIVRSVRIRQFSAICLSCYRDFRECIEFLTIPTNTTNEFCAWILYRDFIVFSRMWYRYSDLII